MAYISPTTMSLDYTHQTDIKVSGKPPKIFTNSLMDLLEDSKEFSIFAKIVKRGQYYNFLKNPQTNVTMFVPANKYISHLASYVENMDVLSARQLVQACMLNRKICSNVITASPIIYLVTKLPANKLEITNMKIDREFETFLNGKVKVVKFDIQVDNGVLHITDGVVYPVTGSTMHYAAQTY